MERVRPFVSLPRHGQSSRGTVRKQCLPYLRKRTRALQNFRDAYRLALAWIGVVDGSQL